MQTRGNGEGLDLQILCGGGFLFFTGGVEEFLRGASGVMCAILDALGGV